MENITVQQEKRARFLGLSGTAIKLLALGLMLLDHLHYFFEFTGIPPLWFSMLGRISGWLFLFVAVEGFSHTSNRKKYFLRIWLMGAAMGGINLVIALLLRRGDGFYPLNNIFATLTVLVVLWQGIDWLKAKKFLPGLAAIAIPFVLVFAVSSLPTSLMGVAYALESTVLPLPFMTEGGTPFILGGLVLYLLRRKRGLQVGIWAAVVLGWNLYIGIAYGLPFGMQWITYHFEWMGVFAAVPMLLYNGQRGRGMKNLFYVFYPAHVYVLYALSCLTYTLIK